MLEQFDKKAKPFKTPENYFEHFNANIMDKLPAKEKNVAKKVSLWKKVLPWSAVAALFFGVVFSTGILNKRIPEMGNEHATTISLSERQHTIEDDYYEFLKDETVTSKYNEALYSGN